MSASAPPAPLRSSTTLLRAILGVGVALRLGLTLVNREANDDHLAVVRFLADHGRFPALHEVWESFQPKLYHLIVFALWRALGLESDDARILAGQLVSCVAGIGTIVVLLRFLERRTLDPRTRVLTFALVAWNPGLIAINAQATNDSLVILLGTIALAAGVRFLADDGVRSFWTMTSAAAAATVTKGNGLVLPLAIAATGAVLRLASRRDDVDARLVARRCGHALLVCAVVAFLFGPYRWLTVELGSPLANPALVEAPWPALLEKTEHGRPGVRSVAEAFFTFPLADLIAHPVAWTGSEVREISRTSFWAILYARVHFSRYAATPPGWESDGVLVPWLGRALLLLALAPSALLVVGVVRTSVRVALAPVRRRLDRAVRVDVLLTLAAWGYLAMAVIYAARLRDFGGTKEIFVYPALVAFASFFASEADRLGARPRRWRAFATIGWLLALGYLIDLGALIAYLAA